MKVGEARVRKAARGYVHYHLESTQNEVIILDKTTDGVSDKFWTEAYN